MKTLVLAVLVGFSVLAASPAARATTATPPAAQAAIATPPGTRAAIATPPGARAAIATPPGARAAIPVVREWRFDATLDGRPIGVHTFRVSELDGNVEVDSRARFDVRVLGFSLYSYDHHARETWKDGCLVALDSRTDDNGSTTIVSGARGEEGFELKRGDATTRLPPCTMTFAYWNPAIRSQSRLLNPQTGEYLDVAVEAAGATNLDGRQSTRYVLRGTNLEIELWYGAGDDRWLALESRTSGGGLVSYRNASAAPPGTM